MSVEADIRNRLANASEVSALVGTRVYPIPLPQEASVPAVTFQRIATDWEHTSTNDPGECHTLFQVDAWADTLASALSLRDAVNAALARYRDNTVSVEIFDVFQDGEQHFYEEDARMHRVIMDFMVHHTEYKAGFSSGFSGGFAL